MASIKYMQWVSKIIQPGNKMKISIKKAIEKALQVLEESLYEPSERGAGSSTTEEAQDKAFEILKKCLNELYKQ